MLPFATTRSVYSCIFLSGIVGLCSACGADGGSNDGLADAGVDIALDPDADAGLDGDANESVPPTCALDVEDAAVGAGSLVTLEWATDAPSGTLSLSAPAGWASWIVDGELSLRAGYLSPGEVALQWAIDCGDGTVAETTSTVAVSEMSWSVEPEWTGENGPSWREHPSVWIHPSEPDAIYLWGGLLYRPAQFTPAYDLWRYDMVARTWESVEQSDLAPEHVAGRVAASAVPGEVFYYGGERGTETNPALWSLDVTQTPAQWTKRSDDSAQGALLAGVARRGNDVFGFGGFDYERGPNMNVEMWNAQTVTWDLVTTGGEDGVPNGRYGFFYGYDESSQRVVLYSGAGMPSADDNVNAHSDSWALDLSGETPTWALLQDGTDAPTGRRNGCGAWDPIGQRLFVWGGTADAMSTQLGLFALHVNPDGTADWHTIELESAPDERASCVGVYDAARNRIVMGFGNNSRDIYADWNALQL